MFDIKLDGFSCKAHLIAGDHMTETYVSGASRDSVCIALTIATLNDLQVKTFDYNINF